MKTVQLVMNELLHPINVHGEQKSYIIHWYVYYKVVIFFSDNG